MSDIVTSGETREYDSGAHRDSADGKPQWSLLWWEFMERLVEHYTKGAEHYGKGNWQKGMPASDYFDSMMRHIMAFMRGELEEDHGAAAVWNLIAMIWTAENAGGVIDESFENFTELLG